MGSGDDLLVGFCVKGGEGDEMNFAEFCFAFFTSIKPSEALLVAFCAPYSLLVLWYVYKEEARK